MKRLLICMLLFIVGYSPLYAQLQGQAKIDSLLRELPAQKDDTGKAALLADISHGYASFKPDEGIRYGVQGLNLAKKLVWKRGMANLNLVLGINCRSKGDFIRALEYYQEAARLYEEAGNKHGLARSTGNVGSIYRSLGDTAQALVNFDKAVNIFKKLNDTAGIAIFTGNIGNLYCDDLKDYPKALEYMLSSLKLYEAIGDNNGIARTMYNLGNVYGYQKKYATAIAYFEQSLKIAEEMGDKGRISDNLTNISGVYTDILEDTLMRGKLNDLGTSLPSGKTELLRKALSYSQKSIAIADEIGDLYAMMECNKQLSKVYSLSGDYKSALSASDKFHALQDSMFSQENRDQMVKLGAKYEYDRQRYADSLKVAEREKIGAIQLQKQKTFTYLGIAGILLLAGFSFFIIKERGKSERERKKSDGLLLNILPAEVADELKKTGSTTARHYDNVTVLFTDFVNFTQASERMSPQELIDELHTCFKTFDEIVVKHNIEKMKTIGDAYLAVAGLPTADAKHAEQTVRAATEINAFMQDRVAKLGDRTFEVRIGIHSGSVVAGIVGVKKFAYDIWGDTVNTAARMEQHGAAGKINISQTTYELVKDKFNCEYRGEVDAKNKGMMKMYFVS